jgi:uncharacterized Zn-binding protein involved in type VI secretion
MGAAILEDAARRFVDPIEHSGSWLGKIIGGIVGFVAAVAITAFLLSNPIGWAAAGTLLLAGSVGIMGGELLGGLIGSLFDYDAGDILEGSPNVTVGHRTLPAARVKDKTKCHNQKIAEGCLTISINREPAARVKSRTECNGKVKEGCTTVKYGGPWIQVLEIKDPDEPTWYKVFKEVVDWAGMFLGVAGLFKGAASLSLRALGRAAATNIGTAWRTGGFWARAALVHEVADPAVFLFQKGSEYSGASYVNGPAYQTFMGAWTAAGTAKGLNDARQAFSARPPGSPEIVTPDAPSGYSRSEGGVLTPDAPAGMTRTDGGVLVGSHPEGRINVDNQTQFQGQTYNRTESGLFVPQGSGQITPASAADIPVGANRVNPPPQGGGLLDASGRPLPPQASRVEPPPPPSAPSPTDRTDLDLNTLIDQRAQQRNDRVSGGLKVIKGGLDVNDRGGKVWDAYNPQQLGAPPPPAPVPPI